MTTQQETLTEDTAPTTPSHDVPAFAGSFNLGHEIDELRNSRQYDTSGHAARTLVRLPAFRVVLFVLHRKTQLKGQRVAQPVTIQTLTGRVRIVLPECALEQAVGEIVMLESGLVHDVNALTDSAILLSMPWSGRAEGQDG